MAADNHSAAGYAENKQVTPTIRAIRAAGDGAELEEDLLIVRPIMERQEEEDDNPEASR